MMVHFSVEQPAPSHQGQCGVDSQVAAAVSSARAAFPDNLPSEQRRLGRNNFLGINKWKLFDADGDGRMSFEEYVDYEWATFLMHTPPGTCTVSEAQYVYALMGDPSDPQAPAHKAAFLNSALQDFRATDRKRQGYITRADLRLVSRQSFDLSDRNHDGFIEQAEVQPLNIGRE